MANCYNVMWNRRCTNLFCLMLTNFYDLHGIFKRIAENSWKVYGEEEGSLYGPGIADYTKVTSNFECVFFGITLFKLVRLVTYKVTN